MPQNTVDLVDIFQTVTQTLAKNQKTLDHADTYNQDHGTNMVDTFQTITGALEKKRGSTDSAALAYAAKTLSQKAKSSSGKQYAQNLSKAADQFKGKKVDEKGALQLLQTLIGSQAGQIAGSSGQAAGGGGDMLGALLGGLAGGETPAQGSAQTAGGDMLGALLGGLAGGETPSQSSPEAGGDMLGALLGGLTGGESSGGKQDGIKLENLIAGGLAYLQAKQSGKGNLEALVQAFVAGSGMGSAAHRTQSTQLVVQSFLQALSSAGSRS